MSDEMDALKRKIKKLERELTLQKVGDDPRRLALLDAGVPLDRLADASKVFRPSGSTATAARASGHLLGTSYIAGHVQQGTTSRYVHPRIEDARRVLNARFGQDATEPTATAGNGGGNVLSKAFDTPCVESEQGTENDTHTNAKDSTCLGC